jgi:tetratricopeptide (TPR) repeat protein
MARQGRALLTGLLAWLVCPVASAELSTEAREAFEAQNWLSAIEHLETERYEPGALRLLALSHFYNEDFGPALPLLESAVAESPDDVELNTALMEVLLANRAFREAANVAARLAALGAADAAAFGTARIQVARGERAAALSSLQELVEGADPDLAARAADLLIELLYENHEYERAYDVAKTALRRSPDSPLAYRFSRIQPDPANGGGIRVDLGYRFEYDDNVTFPDEIFASGKEDTRHVLMADLRYQHPFGRGWHVYAEGHAYQSLHSDYSEFNQTRLVGTLGIRQQGERFGWRLPLEVYHDRLDGDSYRTSLAALPGVSVNLGPSYLGYLYARLQSDDYADVLFPEEDRSGDVSGVGLLLTGRISPRFQLRGYAELNRYDTDGAYWERDELVAFVFGAFEITSRWIAGVAVRYQDEDYDNARPVFAERQHDESRELYLNVTHQFSDNWRWRGQVSHVDHQSNIPIFDYDRNVYSISIMREF